MASCWVGGWTRITKLSKQYHNLATAVRYFNALAETIVGAIIGISLRTTPRRQRPKERVVAKTLGRSLLNFAFISLLFVPVFLMTGIPIYTAFVIGSISLASAPENSIPTIESFQSKNNTQTTYLSLAVINDLFCVFLFYITLSLVSTFLRGGGFSWLSMIETLIAPTVIGMLFGWGFAMISKKTPHLSPAMFSMLALIGAGTLTFFFNTTVHRFPLSNYFLVGVITSAFFINLCPKESQTRVEWTLRPIIFSALHYTVFMIGIPLHYSLVIAYFSYTLIYLISTAIFTRFEDAVARRSGEKQRTLVKYIRLTLLPNTGISLFLTGIAVSKISMYQAQTALIIQGTLTITAILAELFQDFLSYQSKAHQHS